MTIFLTSSLLLIFSSYVVTNGILFEFVLSDAGPYSLALRDALLITFSGYLQLFNQFFNSFNLYYVFSSFETLLPDCTGHYL